MAIESIFPDKASDTSSSYEVGDMRNSIKDYLGEEWLICDGNKINGDAYPDVFNLLKNNIKVDNVSWNSIIASNDTSTPVSVTDAYYSNGYYVLCGYPVNNQYPYIWYSTDINGPWTAKQIYTASTAVPKSICCYNGLWIAAGYCMNTNNGPYIWYTNNPAGTWTAKKLYNSSTENLYNIQCYDGLWTATSRATLSNGNIVSYIYYTTNHTGTWSRITSSTNHSINFVKYYNNIYVAGGSIGGYPYIWYTDNLNGGSWSSVQISSSTQYRIIDICYYDGLWVTIGQSDRKGYILYSTDLNTWTLVKDDCYVNTSICCCGGTWFVCSQTYSSGIPYIYYTNDPTGTWITQKLSTERLELESINENNGTIYTVGCGGSNTVPYIYYADLVKMPEITNVSGINTFIKVKSTNSGYSLPGGYMALDYIEGTGSQYIDTSFKPNQDTRVVMDVDTGTASAEFWFGARTTNTTVSYCFCTLSNTSIRSDHGSNDNVSLDVTNASGRFIIDRNKNICEFGDNVITNTDTDFQCVYNLYLLSANTAGTASSTASGKVYSCKIYDNDTLIRDYIPVMNESGVAGLWDLVEKKFYGSATSTAFIAGNILA